jgi:hypothetical protein
MKHAEWAHQWGNGGGGVSQEVLFADRDFAERSTGDMTEKVKAQEWGTPAPFYVLRARQAAGEESQLVLGLYRKNVVGSIRSKTEVLADCHRGACARPPSKKG